MEHQTATLYIKDSSSPNNYRLITFLKEHLSRINQAGLRIVCKIANTNESDFYKEHDIYGFPALMLNNAVSIGNQEIEQFLVKIMNRRTAPKNDEEDVENWLIKTVKTHSNGAPFMPPKPRGYTGSDRQKTEEPLIPSADSDDEDDDESKKLQMQVQQALRDRIARDPKFGKGMQTAPPPPAASGNTDDQHTRQIKSRQRKPPPRPSNTGGSSIGQKIKSGVIPSDNELLNNLFANQE